jgi:hypothetical protein
MVAFVSVVVTNHAPIIAWEDMVIDVGQVIPRDLPGGFIDPDFPAQFPISALVGNFVGFVDNLHISHD